MPNAQKTGIHAKFRSTRWGGRLIADALVEYWGRDGRDIELRSIGQRIWKPACRQHSLRRRNDIADELNGLRFGVAAGPVAIDHDRESDGLPAGRDQIA